jgi:hypothetical protein
MLNNNFIAGGNAYVLYVESGASVARSNYNNMLTTGTVFAKWGSNNYSGLPGYQTGTNLDTNSISVDPVYYSNSDLHTANPLIYAAGTPVSGITTDIDGDLRNTTAPCIGADEFLPLQFDVAAIAIVQPNVAFAPATATKTVEVRIRNYGTDTITSIPVAYKYANNNPVVETWGGTLLPGASVSFVFNTQFAVLPGDLNLCVYTNLPNDMKHSNDTVCMVFTGIPLLNISYWDNFDGGPNYWVSDGNLWEHGTPAQTSLNGALSAPNAWMTHLASNYSNNADASLYSPYFDVANFNSATLKFYQKRRVATNDQAVVEYSIDQGQNWVLLGYMGDPAATNWYNKQANGQHYFGGNLNTWTLSTYDMSAILNPPSGTHPQNIRFRFRFISNSSTTDEGWLIDNFALEAPKIQYDGGVVDIVEPDTMTAIGDTVTVKVKVTNYGYDTLNSIPLRYTVNGVVPVQETWTAAGQGLAPGDTMIYTFTTSYLSPATQYTVCAYTQISGDVYTNNDKTCKSVLVATPVLDAYVHLIVSPVDTMSFNKPATVTIRIINHGTTPLTSIPVQYKVNNNAPVQETWTGAALQYGDSVDYTFSAKIANQPIGTYNLCARTLLMGDQIPYNDERCKLIVTTDLGEMIAANNMKLWQNVPNPASAQTMISYEIPKGGKVVFKMYNMMGEQVMSREYKRNAGKHNIKIDASTLTSGVYFYSIEFDGERLTKRMLISK